MTESLPSGSINHSFAREHASILRNSVRDRVLDTYSAMGRSGQHPFIRSDSSAEILRDAVKVEIADIECNSSTNITIGALRRCKEQIVNPFYTILSLVGWRQFGYGRVSFGSLKWKIFNTAYLITTVSLMLFAYLYQILACQYGLTEEEIQIVTPNPITPKTNSTSLPILTMVPSIQVTTSKPQMHKGDKIPICSHLLTTYVIPNLMHAFAYILGLIHFRAKYTEDLHALMEKVFLYCQSSPLRQVSQYSLVFRLRAFLIGLLMWMTFSIATHVLNDIAFVKHWGNTRSQVFNVNNGEPVSYILLVIDMAGYVAISAVTMTVVFNYVVNCEMIVFYAGLVKNKLQERSLNLRVAVKDLHAIKMATKRLNGTTSHMVSIILIVILELFTIGVNTLIRNRYCDPIIWVYRAFFIIYLIPVGLLPLIQACRVNTHCTEFREKVLDIRTYGYQDAGQLELDSIVLFVMANRFQAKIMYLPVRKSYLIVMFVLTAFVMLLLFQNGVFSTHSLV